jgi:hypothetical protein
MRRAIFILSFIGTGLLVLDYVAYYIAAAIAGENLHDVNLFFGVATIFVFIIFAAANGVAYILGLVDTIRNGRWGWFAAILLLPALGTLIYGVTGLRTASAESAVA